MTARRIIRSSPERPAESWHPTLLSKLGKDESFLQRSVAAEIELLGIQTLRSRISGPYAIFQELPLSTPMGRAVRPDVVALAASGHVIVVEVKLSNNPELRDRAVIAQIIDYASSFAALDEESATALFGRDVPDAATWGSVVHRNFPDVVDAEELAETLIGCMRAGEINLVIACDRVPPGLAEIVQGIAAQRTLGFELDLVEIVPYVRGDDSPDDILLVPTSRLSTEIVARTAVTVIYRQGESKPEANVQTTSMEEIQENIRAAQQPATKGRVWTQAEVVEMIRAEGNEVEKKLLEFTLRHSDAGQVVSEGLKSTAAFGFYVPGATAEGKRVRQMLFYCVLGWELFPLKLNLIEQLVDQSTMAEFKQRLVAAMGETIDVRQKAMNVSVTALQTRLPAFEQTMLWIKQKIEDEATRRLSPQS